MSDPARGLTVVGIVLRILALLAIVVLATWASHLVRNSLNLQIMPSNEQQVHAAIMLGMAAYIGLLAMPFVPGAEIGLALLTAFGASIAPLVYAATVVALVLAYAVGRILPIAALQRGFAALKLRRAADLVERVAPLSREERLRLLLDGAPPRVLALALHHRYVALAVAINTPGNSLIGGGGGLALMAGLSGIFAPVPTFLAIAIAVSPVPLAIVLLGA